MFLRRRALNYLVVETLFFFLSSRCGQWDHPTPCAVRGEKKAFSISAATSQPQMLISKYLQSVSRKAIDLKMTAHCFQLIMNKWGSTRIKETSRNCSFP
uniref:Putative secreted protein n=1 Tax=Ixodes ricinus TaxID=34613 RepID=A0A6B0UI70_IXORI